jgi:hypothetical protein
MLQLLRVRHQPDVTFGTVHPTTFHVNPVDVQVPVVLGFEDLPARFTWEVSFFVPLLVHHEPTYNKHNLFNYVTTPTHNGHAWVLARYHH